jgi:hypothetical protein
MLWLIVKLQFNCFLLMPIVDKLAALLREDLESAFEDDLDGIFNATQLRHSLGQMKRELEVELKRVRSLLNRFSHLPLRYLNISLPSDILLLDSDQALKREVRRNK